MSKRHQATATVSVDGEPTDVDQEELDAAFPPLENVQPGEPLAEVGVHYGLTINTGNYESVKLDVSIRFPCYPNKESVDATYEAVQSWAQDKIRGEAAPIRGARRR
jgi:hypothetical protein